MPQEFASYLWLLPTALASFAVKFLRDMAISVAKLNENIAVLISRVDVHEDKLSDHEVRLRGVELGPKH